MKNSFFRKGVHEKALYRLELPKKVGLGKKEWVAVLSEEGGGGGFIPNAHYDSDFLWMQVTTKSY